MCVVLINKTITVAMSWCILKAKAVFTSLHPVSILFNNMTDGTIPNRKPHGEQARTL